MSAPLDALLAARNTVPGNRQRPFVCLSYAQSLDGCIALRDGQPHAISGSESLAFTHSLRANHDAILVGIGTILADDPQLNVRFVEGPAPQPIILDNRLRTPIESKVLAGSKPPWIATRTPATDPLARRLIERDARLMTFSNSSGPNIPLAPLLSMIGSDGIDTLMVEGGARIIQDFLQSRVVDWIILTISPKILAGLPAIGRLDSAQPITPLDLDHVGWTQCQEDLIVWGQPRWGAP